MSSCCRLESCSTVCKPRSPRVADPPPAFSSSSLLGGGLSELDHLLQELNATQFNITGESALLCLCICNTGLCLTLFLSFSFFLHHQMRSWLSSPPKKTRRTRLKRRQQRPPGAKPDQRGLGQRENDQICYRYAMLC